MRTSPLLALLFALSLPSCVVLEDPDWIGDDDDSVAGDDDDDDVVEPCTDPSDPENWIVDPPDEWVVAASFITPDGEPVRDLMITLCGGACYNEPTNCDGVVYFPFAETDQYVIEPLFAIDLDFATWSRSFDFLGFDAAGPQVDVSDTPFTIPAVEEIETVGSGPQERIFSSGLEVRFDGDALDLPFGPEEPTLGAVEIPAARFPTGGLRGWTPLRVWALAVWDAEIEEPEGFQVVAPLNEAVPEGAEVTFLVAHYDYGIVEGTFEELPAELAADRMSISTPANQGIDRATMWIAAMRTPTE